jgi:hypothetical protein
VTILRGRMPISIRAFDYALEPGLLPEQQARSLATIVGGAVTAQRLKMNRVFYSPRLAAGAGTVGAPQHTKPLPAVLLHLGHERKTVQFAVEIEANGYFRRASNRDQITGFQVK